MNDLRRDINEVFAKQQVQLSDVASTSNRMLRAATGGRRVNRQLMPSLAGVALVLVAASAIGVSVVIRGLHPKNVVTNHASPTPNATPAPTPVPTPMSQLLQVPATTPVILFQDPVDRQQIDGSTWDGSARGRVGVTEAGMGFVQNPAGTLYGWTGSIHDRTGAVVGTLPANPNSKGFPGTWADDGRHICSMFAESAFGQAGGRPTTLQLTTVGQAPRNVVQVGRVYEQTSIAVAACSIEKDRAVVVQAGSIGNAVQFWVIQLSTGRTLWTRSYAADGPIVHIQPSRDAEFIAEDKNNCCPTTAVTTTIYGPTGAVLAHPAGPLDAFSWDGSLAVIGNFNGPVSVVRWRDGTVVWNGPSDGVYVGAMPEPGGQRIAVIVSDPEHPEMRGIYGGNVYVVGPDGQAVELLKSVTF
jgi:hypothetical protein